MQSGVGAAPAHPPCTHLCHVPGLVAVASAGEDGGPDVLPTERGRALQPAQQAVGTLPCLGEHNATRSAQGLKVLTQDPLQLGQPGVLIAVIPSKRLQPRPVLCTGDRRVRDTPNAASITPLQTPCYPQRWW